jgi:hypothetical protein
MVLLVLNYFFLALMCQTAFAQPLEVNTKVTTKKNVIIQAHPPATEESKAHENFEIEVQKSKDMVLNSLEEILESSEPETRRLNSVELDELRELVKNEKKKNKY